MLEMLKRMLPAAVVTLTALSAGRATSQESNGLAFYTENPFYWQYDGQPVMLLGGSNNDNLFQSPDAADEVRLLKSVGGNYLRCTMSSRDPGDAKPYLKTDGGRFDLQKPNPVFWDRFARFLEVTAENDVVIQVELWATYDFYDGADRWNENPFNPANNVNYDPETSGLPEVIEHKAWEKINPFFSSVPSLDDNSLLLRYQQAFVDRVLEFTLPYGHVLYSVDNETNAHPDWGRYWAQYLRGRARDAGRRIFVTEMWDNWDPTGGRVPGIRRVQFDGNHPHRERSTPLNTID